MFMQEKPPKPEMQMRLFFRAKPFYIGFKNAHAANANPGMFPCPLVASPGPDYYSVGMMSGVITPEEMDEVTKAFEKEMAKVHPRDNHEKLRACILERLWLTPYGKMREDQRKRAEREKERLEYNARGARVKEREIARQAREEAAAKKQREQKRIEARATRDAVLGGVLAKRAAEEAMDLEEGEVQEKQEKHHVAVSSSLAHKRRRGANASWRTSKGVRTVVGSLG
jgi:hypothetical protein